MTGGYLREHHLLWNGAASPQAHWGFILPPAWWLLIHMDLCWMILRSVASNISQSSLMRNNVQKMYLKLWSPAGWEHVLCNSTGQISNPTCVAWGYVAQTKWLDSSSQFSPGMNNNGLLRNCHEDNTCQVPASENACSLAIGHYHYHWVRPDLWGGEGMV